MKRVIYIIMCVFMATSVFADTAEEVKQMIVRVNNAWQQSHPAPEYGGSKKGMSAFWDNAVYMTGNIEACLAFQDVKVVDDNVAAWLRYSYDWAEKNNWCGATERDASRWLYKQYGEKPQYVLFGDWQICFQTYIDLYNFSRDNGVYSLSDMLPKANDAERERYVERAKEVMSYEAKSEATDYWWWADALYMVMPVMTKMYKLTGDETYLQKMYDNWQHANSIMYDNETGLYFRDGKYVYPKHTTAAGKKDFWARGDGWVMAAFAKVLRDLPTKDKHRKEYVKYYKKMAKAVVKCQQTEQYNGKEIGYWTRSMHDAEQAPGYETSGTALMCYSLFWGINNGVLPKSMLPAAQRAWNYLANVALQDNSTIGFVQPIGEKAIPGQVVDKASQANFGTGVFLLAASEYLRYLNN